MTWQIPAGGSAFLVPAPPPLPNPTLNYPPLHPSTTHTMFRQAVARAPRALARRSPAGANRQAHDLAHQLEHYNPAATGSFDAFGVKEIKDSRIAHGERAFVWEIPKDLKPNAFIKRRKAVEEHAFCEFGLPGPLGVC